MDNTIEFIIASLFTIVCFILSYLQFSEKGYLLNNSYIFASKQDREKLNKKPYYKQSGVVFLLIGIVFLTIALDIIFKEHFLFYCAMAILAAALVYAVISSVILEKKNK